MRNKKIYKTPKADITAFECKDIITRSLNGAIDALPTKIGGGGEYMKTGESIKWQTSWLEGLKD